uniref:Uncharacterized protein n=1 Tax=Triticum urartu TaxID=4572 RepID=A0A8R7PQP0_TRIUA
MLVDCHALCRSSSERDSNDPVVELDWRGASNLYRFTFCPFERETDPDS